MNNREIKECAICKSDFYVEKMKDGKCDLCHTRFPNAKSLEELNKQREIEKSEFNKGSFESRVRTEVEKSLKEFAILSECECGNFYYRRSPNQKVCGLCKEDK